MSAFRIALVQCANPVNDARRPLEEVRAAALSKQLRLAERAAEAGARLVCFQEMATGPVFTPGRDRRWLDLGEPVPGPSTEEVAAFARRAGAVVVLPLVERGTDGRAWNSAAVFDADGTLLGVYRKTHVPALPAFPEDAFFEPGDELPVFDTAVGRIGVYLCYDRHFPEVPRSLALAGAELLLCPSATLGEASARAWEAEHRAAAVANGCWVGAVNRVGVEPPWNVGRYYGRSMVVDPWGVVVAEAGDADEVLVAEVDLAQGAELRRSWRMLDARRPELYGRITAR